MTLERIPAPADARSGAAPEAPERPSAQLPPAEPELFERARAAITELRGRGRDPATGQAAPGNTLNLRHGLRSLRLFEHPDIRSWHAEQVAAITTDLGGEAELSTLQRAAVREVARLEVILGALGHELFERGVLTGKGKTRSATMLYLHVLDRFSRVSAAVGLHRREKPVPSLADLVAPAALSAPQTPPTTSDTPAPAPAVDRVPAPAPAAPSATFGEEW